MDKEEERVQAPSTQLFEPGCCRTPPPSSRRQRRALARAHARIRRERVNAGRCRGVGDDPVAQCARRRPHDRSFAPNARAPSFAPNRISEKWNRRRRPAGGASGSGASGSPMDKEGARERVSKRPSSSVRPQPESCPFRFGVVSLGPVYGWHPLSPSTAVSSRGGRIISVRPEPQVATSANRRPGGASGSYCAGRSADRARRVGARLTRARSLSASWCTRVQI